MAGFSPSGLIGLGLFGVVMATAMPAHALLPVQPLNLTCYGEAAIRQTGKQQAVYKGYVEVRLTGDDARIQLPRGFRPSSSDSGWYKIKYLKASDADIIGNAIVSFIDKPFFRVDRVTGRIDVSGLSGTFVGECRKAGS